MILEEVGEEKCDELWTKREMDEERSVVGPARQFSVENWARVARGKQIRFSVTRYFRGLEKVKLTDSVIPIACELEIVASLMQMQKFDESPAHPSRISCILRWSDREREKVPHLSPRRSVRCSRQCHFGSFEWFHLDDKGVSSDHGIWRYSVLGSSGRETELSSPRNHSHSCPPRDLTSWSSLSQFALLEPLEHPVPKLFLFPAPFSLTFSRSRVELLPPTWFAFEAVRHRFWSPSRIERRVRQNWGKEHLSEGWGIQLVKRWSRLCDVYRAVLNRTGGISRRRARWFLLYDRFVGRTGGKGVSKWESRQRRVGRSVRSAGSIDRVPRHMRWTSRRVCGRRGIQASYFEIRSKHWERHSKRRSSLPKKSRGRIDQNWWVAVYREHCSVEHGRSETTWPRRREESKSDSPIIDRVLRIAD